MRVVTSFWLKPMPDRRCDWSAVTSDYSGEPSDPIGYGATEAEAVEDLLDQLEPDNSPPLPKWPKHPDGRNKTMGEMTPDEKRAQLSAAADRFKAGPAPVSPTGAV